MRVIGFKRLREECRAGALQLSGRHCAGAIGAEDFSSQGGKVDCVRQYWPTASGLVDLSFSHTKSARQEPAETDFELTYESAHG